MPKYPKTFKEQENSLQLSCKLLGDHAKEFNETRDAVGVESNSEFVRWMVRFVNKYYFGVLGGKSE